MDRSDSDWFQVFLYAHIGIKTNRACKACCSEIQIKTSSQSVLNNPCCPGISGGIQVSSDLTSSGSFHSLCSPKRLQKYLLSVFDNFFKLFGSCRKSQWRSSPCITCDHSWSQIFQNSWKVLHGVYSLPVYNGPLAFSKVLDTPEILCLNHQILALLISNIIYYLLD